MDISEKYFSLIGSKFTPQARKEYFYDTISSRIDEYNSKFNILNYTKLLALEVEVNNMIEEISKTFSHLEVAGSSDLQEHFQGIKSIITIKMHNLLKNIKQRKNIFFTENVEIEPDFSNRKESDSIENTNTSYNKLKQELEEELKIDTSLASIQKNILEIKQIQTEINKNLYLQSEKIENVLKKNKTSEQGLIGSKQHIKKNKVHKRRARRLLFIFQLIVIFILIFLHCYYQ